MSNYKTVYTIGVCVGFCLGASTPNVTEISDSWDTIITNIDNGTYKKYDIGQYKPLDLGTEGTINMQIVAMDADELASGGTAPLSFLGMSCLSTPIKYDNDSAQANWNICDLRSYLSSNILPLISSTVVNRIQNVRKYSRSDGDYNALSTDKLWIPSVYEIVNFWFNGKYSWIESSGVTYTNVFKTQEDIDIDITYWLRSHSGIQAVAINDNGSAVPLQANSNLFGVRLGFCLGLESETIEDSWETILANENYATDYSIGDTKMLDLGTEGKHLMEIVAIDEDDRADGNGKAGLTWISKDLLNTTHRMNPSRAGDSGNYTIGTGSIGGWENSEMRTYLKNTIKPLIPSTVRNGIVAVSKISHAYNTSATAFQQTTTDDVWIPSHYEVFHSTDYEQSGATYTNKFTSIEKGKKKQNGSDKNWWTRTGVSNGTSFSCITERGYTDVITSSYATPAVALGFCTN